MKRMLLVTGLMVVLLVIGVVAVSGVQIGNRNFSGSLLPVGVRLNEDMFSGKVDLPANGYLYVFYKGGPDADQYLIFPNKENPSEYRAVGLNSIDLSMLYPMYRAQKLTVVFSRHKLLNIDFGLATERFLLVDEIDQYNFWLGPSSSSVWVAELYIPSTTVGAGSCWWTTIRRPVCPPRPVSICCYQPRPCCSVGCPQTPCLLWWWLLGFIILH